jgi:bacteriocin-like protein
MTKRTSNKPTRTLTTNQLANITGGINQQTPADWNELLTAWGASEIDLKEIAQQVGGSGLVIPGLT